MEQTLPVRIDVYITPRAGLTDGSGMQPKARFNYSQTLLRSIAWYLNRRKRSEDVSTFQLNLVPELHTYETDVCYKTTLLCIYDTETSLSRPTMGPT